MLPDSIFAGSDLHARQVDLGGGQVVELWFKELPAVDFIRYHAMTTSTDEDVRAGAAAKLVSKSLVNPDGSAALTYERALTLTTKPLNAIFTAVLEVNGGSSGKS